MRVAAGPSGGRVGFQLLWWMRRGIIGPPHPVLPPLESLPGIWRILPFQDHLLVDHGVRPGPPAQGGGKRGVGEGVGERGVCGIAVP